MVLTTAEVSWIGAVIVAGLGLGSARIILIASRSSDHHQRIWARSSELYEDLLVYVRALTLGREKAMQTLMTDDERTVLQLGQAERQRLAIRLEMFGHLDVQAAFERYLDAHWKWIACEEARQFASQTNKEAIEQQILQMPVSSEETARLRDDRKAASDLADQRDRELRDAVRDAVHRVPKARWRRIGRC
jgi:7-keto-8-aminopelargonate synthetase-like enzyme